MTGLLLLAFTGLGIYAIRASFLVAGPRVRLGRVTRRALEHARPALLAALLVDVVTGPQGGWSPDPRAAAVVVLAAVAARRGGTAAAVPTGFAVIAVLGVAY